MGMAIVGVTGPLFALISPEPGVFMEVVSNDIPADARFVGVEFHTDCFYATIESPSLPDVPPGSCLPRLTGPTFRRVDCLPQPEIMEKPS